MPSSFLTMFTKKRIPEIKRQKSIVGLAGNKGIGNLADVEMDAHLDTNINENKIYSNFYKTLTIEEKHAINTYQIETPSEFYNNSIAVTQLNNIFEKVPELPSTIYVYRCFIGDVSIDTLNESKNFAVDGTNRFMSTTFAYNTARKFCGFKNEDMAAEGVCYENNDKIGNLIICIIIPIKSKVLPFMSSISQPGYGEYEILLPSSGRIVQTGQCHPKHKVPIFIFRDATSSDLEDEEKTKLIKEMFPTLYGGRGYFETIQTKVAKKTIKKRHRRTKNIRRRCNKESKSRNKPKSNI